MGLTADSLLLSEFVMDTTALAYDVNCISAKYCSLKLVDTSIISLTIRVLSHCRVDLACE